MTEKVEKLHNELTKFMADFERCSDENTEHVNKVIASLDCTLQTEKEALSSVRYKKQHDNSELNTYVVSNIDQLQKDLATKNNLMDKLAQKNEKAEVLSIKLTYANKHLDDLESKKTVRKSCFSEVNHYLHYIVGTRDSLLSLGMLTSCIQTQNHLLHASHN